MWTQRRVNIRFRRNTIAFMGLMFLGFEEATSVRFNALLSHCYHGYEGVSLQLQLAVSTYTRRLSFEIYSPMALTFYINLRESGSNFPSSLRLTACEQSMARRAVVGFIHNFT